MPTLNEIGIKDQEAETMTGVFVPAGTPKAIVDLLQKEISAIVKSPDIRPRLLELGVVPEGDTPAEFAAYVKAEVAKWKRVIEARRQQIQEDQIAPSSEPAEAGPITGRALRGL